MQIVVSARHGEITNEMKEYAERKTSKLLKYYDKIQEIEVILDRESAKHRVEIIVNAEHRNMFVATETDDDCFAATDLVVDKMERQLTKHKEKHRNRKHLNKHSEKSEETTEPA
ncbi:MAG: ribosome-associated translation inhibitor RaiA [Phycisphaerae bacterium]|nr:ribosome-associated translation inhibitor RaiA [Phycisphaerae bacterium]